MGGRITEQWFTAHCNWQLSLVVRVEQSGVLNLLVRVEQSGVLSLLVRVEQSVEQSGVAKQS